MAYLCSGTGMITAGLIFSALFSGATAKDLGTLTPPPSLTEARIETLVPAAEKPAWMRYLDRAQAMMAADKAALKAERAKLAGKVPPPPPHSMHDHSMPLHKKAAWYSSAPARHIADVIVSFQTPSGGWGKNQDRSGARRLPGQDYVPDNDSRFLKPGDFDKPADPKWHYVGTLDNNATTTEIRFLAKVAKATPGKAGAPYRAAIAKGVGYLLKAQFPNGGWPQVFPLEGGYHDALTYNDDAMVQSLETLSAVARNSGGRYGFLPVKTRKAAKAACDKARAVILKTQLPDSHGAPTIWAQQYDPLILKPVAARNFEPGFPAVSESVPVLIWLMADRQPGKAEVKAIYAGIAWLRKTAITGKAWTAKGSQNGKQLVSKPGAKPIWARYYTADGAPRFADRNKHIHDTVSEISKERRNGYAWYGSWGNKALKRFAAWSKKHPPVK